LKTIILSIISEVVRLTKRSIFIVFNLSAKHIDHLRPHFSLCLTQRQDLQLISWRSPVLIDTLSKRRANAETFKQLFTNGPKCVRNIQWETDKSSWFGFGIILKQEYNRSVVCGYLNNLGIETRPIVAGNFLNQPVVDKYIIKADHPQFHIRPNVPNAEIIDKHGFFVGNDDRDLTLQLKLLRELLSTF